LKSYKFLTLDTSAVLHPKYVIAAFLAMVSALDKLIPVLVSAIPTVVAAQVIKDTQKISK
jgi:hypothetical protein